jgi:hypothetical protein
MPLRRFDAKGCSLTVLLQERLASGLAMGRMPASEMDTEEQGEKFRDCL